MALSNYTELVSAVANWLSRADLASAIPDFVTLAESQFNRELRVPQMEYRVETNCTASDRYITLPEDFLELVSIRIEDTRYVPLEHVSVEYIDGAYNSAATGMPRVYAMVNNAIYVAPTPDSAYQVEINYYRSLDDLATNSTNWLLQEYPDAYLYGALMQASPYIHDDPRLVVWAGFYQKAISAINVAGYRRRWSGNVLQTKTDSAVV